jgi:putative redox protein
MISQKMTFNGHNGDVLAAKLTLPDPHSTLYAAQSNKAVCAVFAHCFTCSKDVLAARRISAELAAKGIAVLSFDFTGLGHSAGEFSNTNFSSNVEDLVLACAALEAQDYSVQLLVGHSLGGAAVLSAASKRELEGIKAVTVIGAPYHPGHVLENFAPDLDAIKEQGQATVNLGAKEFTIKQSFVDDVCQANLDKSLATMKKALLILHSPIDAQVSVDNAAAIFKQAKHPKSFVSLDDANHLLTAAKDAQYAASVIASWAQRYLELAPKQADVNITEGIVRVSEVQASSFQQDVVAAQHFLVADEPKSFGGTDLGMSPYQLLSSGLGACTNMTIRMYAKLKKLPLESVSVDIQHGKIHAQDCEDCTDNKQKIDQFTRTIQLIGPLSDEQRAKLLSIADKCPVHRTLASQTKIVTQLVKMN